jgi:sugar phosphate isomerase/epimerase
MKTSLGLVTIVSFLALLSTATSLAAKERPTVNPRVEGGTPSQRGHELAHAQAGDVRDTPTYRAAWQRAVELLRSVLDQAGELGLTICLEPLSPVETNFINTVEDGMKMVRELNHPNFKIHLDVKAMSSEPTPVPAIIRSVKAQDIGHFHVNDPNLYGPGMGQVDYGPIAEAVWDIGYDAWLSVEVFKYDPDPTTIAKKSIDYLRRFWP